MTQSGATLIGLDWGTSTLRAYLFGDNGAVLANKTRPWGVLSTPGGDFAAAYHEIVADWQDVDGHLPAIAAGMIGSTQGWIRAPYCGCPTGPGELAAALVEIATERDGNVHVIPGIEQRGSAPDVLRGEETQVTGALALSPGLESCATLLLPGTHAKWVEVSFARITAFTTYMTGELYAVLSEHSILGKPATAVSAPGSVVRPTAWDAFDRGVSLARENDGRGIAPLLFRTRSLVLQGALEPQDSPDFLSGLLIGDEVRSGLAGASSKPVLVGDPALCERYRRGLSAYGVVARSIDDAAPAGLWDIALRARLVAASLSNV